MANFCVKPTATGTGSGADWNNCLGQTYTPARGTGNTYYLADGNYTGKTYSTAVSSTTVITIKKATEADHGPSTGWNTLDGDGQAIFSGMQWFQTSYWIWDGAVGGGPNSWLTGFGFKIVLTQTGVSPDPGIAVGNFGFTSPQPSNYTFQHFEVVGNYNILGGGNHSQDGVAILPGGLPQPGQINVRYFYLHDLGRCPFFNMFDQYLVEYGVTGTYTGNDPDNHSEVMSIYDDAVRNSSSKMIFRYNLILHVSNRSTGGLMIDTGVTGQASASAEVYGNVFFRPAGTTWAGANQAGIGSWDGGNGERFDNVKVANNTFVDINNPGTVAADGRAAFFTIQEVFDTSPTASNCQSYNNLFVNVADPGGTALYTLFTHNHFISTSSFGASPTTGSGNPFVDKVNLNFRLTANTPAGFNTNATLPGNSVDMFGNTRTTFTRGAVEFASAVDVTPPAVPTGLQVT